MGAWTGLGALMLVAVWLPAAAQVYRWVDEKGQVHYSQTPPKSGKSQAVAPSASPAGEGNAGVSAISEYAQQGDKARTRQDQERAKAAQDKERQVARCKSARSQAAFHQQDGVLYSVDENGERRFYNDSERAAKRAEADAQVARECR